jgi:asparagine synthase (glutamine-hydrolysing)
MSAIYGIIHLDGKPVHPDHPNVMVKELSHWNRDGHFPYLKDNVAMGLMHTQLSPESAFEKQPLQYSHWRIVMAGRFFQREELIKKMGLPEADYSQVPDSILLAKAYEKWGNRCVQHFIGEFTFVIWDSQQKKLFAACDQMGIIPLFYYQQSNTLAFATNHLALYYLPFVDKAWDNEYLFHSEFLPALVLPQNTHLKAIKALPTAHTLEISLGGCQSERYWQPSFSGYTSRENPAAHATALYQLIETCIRDRLRTPYPVMSTLSGGLDSSTITVIAARVLAEQGKTLYTAGIEPPPERYGSSLDERQYQRAVVEQEGNISYQAAIPALPQLDEVIRYANAHKLPPSLGIDHWGPVCDYGSANNARLVLTGFLGDDVISRKTGYIPAQLMREHQWRAVFKLVKQIKRQEKHSSLWALKHWVKTLELAFPKLMPKLSKTNAATNQKNVALRAALNKDYLNSFDELWQIHEKSSQKTTGLSLHEALKKLFQQSPATAGYSIAYPALSRGQIMSHVLADVRIIDFATSLPPEQWLPQGQSRGLIRQATKNLLPKEVNQRTTKSFFNQEDLAFYYKNRDRIKHTVETLPANNPLRQYINCNSLIALIKPYTKANDAYSAEALLLFGTVMPMLRVLLSNKKNEVC